MLRITHPNFAYGLEDLQHQVSPSSYSPGSSSSPFRIVLAHPLQVTFDPALHVFLVKDKTKVEHLAVAAVAVADATV